MRLKYIFPLFLFILFPVKGSKDYRTGIRNYTLPMFAMSMTTGANSQPVSFAQVNVLDGKIVKVNYLSVHQFVKQATGFMYSVANPDKRNFLAEWGIEHCLPEYEDYSKKYIGYNCPVIDNLWKLRYMRDPYHPELREDSGWAKGYYAPSLTQQKFLLEEYGLTHMNDFFVGTHLFKLLKDTQDTAWVSKYRNL